MQYLIHIEQFIKFHVAQVTGSNATGHYTADAAPYVAAVLVMLAVYGLVRPAGGKR